MKEISIAVCTDENYALNAAMVLYSAAQNVQKESSIKAYVVDGGISDETKKRFKKIMKGTKLNIIWLNPDLSIFDNLPLSSWITKIAHSRTLLPYIIPENSEKILYLDSDMLILEDITKLWDTPLNDVTLAASESSIYSHIYERPDAKTFINAGMDPSSPYFTSGLLLINISKWKENDTLSKYIKILKEMGNEFKYRTQDPLNIILENKWKPIDANWQVIGLIYHSSDLYHKSLVKNAKIIHFTNTPPGFPKCNHPKKSLFFKYVYHSGWFSKGEYLKWRYRLLIKGLYYAPYLKFLKEKIKGKKMEPFFRFLYKSLVRRRR